MKNTGVTYAGDDAFAVITMQTLDLLFMKPEYQDALILYFFYVKQAKAQHTNAPYAIGKWAMKQLGWGHDRFYKTRTTLKSLNLIEDKKQINKETKSVEKWYTKVRFVWDSHYTSNKDSGNNIASKPTILESQTLANKDTILDETPILDETGIGKGKVLVSENKFSQDNNIPLKENPGNSSKVKGEQPITLQEHQASDKKKSTPTFLHEEQKKEYLGLVRKFLLEHRQERYSQKQGIKIVVERVRVWNENKYKVAGELDLDMYSEVFEQTRERWVTAGISLSYNSIVKFFESTLERVEQKSADVNMVTALLEPTYEQYPNQSMQSAG